MNFNIFFLFFWGGGGGGQKSEYFRGYEDFEDFVDIWGGGGGGGSTKLDFIFILCVISMHLRVFPEGQGTEWRIFFGLLKVQIFIRGA